jgi:hypothetical protein
MIDVLGQIIRFPGIPAFEWVGESHEARGTGGVAAPSRKRQPPKRRRRDGQS